MTERADLFRDIKTRHSNVRFIEEIELELMKLDNCDKSQTSRVVEVCRSAIIRALQERRALLLRELGVDTHA